MDANTLHTTLAGMFVTPPDELRASLYLTELQATRDFLFDTLRNDPQFGGVYDDRFAVALRDPALLDGYCEIIDKFIGASVSADLQCLTTPGQPAPLPAPYTDYGNYFDVNIFLANNGNFATNVQQFYLRRPAAERAVQALTPSFQNNIRVACQRILTNWDDIGRTFARGGRLDRLRAIESTGSDFHKGGQQVLILSFDYLSIVVAQEPYGVDGVVRVIYKPSDIEVDCLIAGNSAAVNAVHANFQVASLFEIINTFVDAARAQTPTLEYLPTYDILPYNFGSGLVAQNGTLPIRSSYGFIQFLEHRDEPGRSLWNWYPFGSGDFRIYPLQDARTITRKFYQVFGQLLAVSSTFSIVDMHMENLIVSRYVPHQIDLEVALTRLIDDVSSTACFGPMGGLTGETIDGVDFTWRPGGAAGNIHLAQVFLDDVEKQNRLWTMVPNARVSPDMPLPTSALLRGFDQGITLLGQMAASPGLDAWFHRLTNTVVRYIPYQTLDFTAVMASIYFDETRVSTANWFQDCVLDMVTGKYNLYHQNPTPLPNFAATQAAYIEPDFRECDIPVFYHRIYTSDIMDSRGIPVAMPVNIAVHGNNNQLVEPAVGRPTFYPAAPTTAMRNAQVTILTNGAAARLAALRRTLISGLRPRVISAGNDLIHQPAGNLAAVHAEAIVAAVYRSEPPRDIASVPVGQDQSIVDRISDKLSKLRLGQDQSLVITPQAVGEDIVTAFFTNVLQTQSITIAAPVTRTKTAPTGIAIKGAADFLSYKGLDATLTVVWDDDNKEAVLSIDATFASDKPVTLPVVTWISLEQVGITASYRSETEMVQFALHRDIISGSGSQAAHIPFRLTPILASEWHIGFGGGASVPVTAEQLVGLVSGNALTTFFPSELTSILDAIEVTGLDAVFDPKAGTVSYFAVGITVKNGWPIAPKVELEPGLHLALTIVDATNAINRQIIGTVTGTFTLNNTELPLFVPGATGEGALWSFGVQPDRKSVV